MANWWQVQRLKRGVDGWNKWRKRHNRKPDLSGANLKNTDLSGANLKSANLSGANLNGVRLWGTELGDANLSNASLIEAIIVGTDLSGANLSRALLFNTYLAETYLNRANLDGAHLDGAKLYHDNLSNADLSRSTFGNTSIIHTDFRNTKGLVLIRHEGPSPIHLPTIQLPQDGSALHFLRGVGLTDSQIDLWHSEMMLPIQYHSLFISYSSKDETLAHHLYADLQAHGVRCWFAPEDMKIGDKIRDRIDQAIHLQDRSLLLLSKHSIESLWVEHEVEAVLEKEACQQREILFPVRLDEGIMKTSKAWAATLRRTRHIGDFTTWTNPQQYQTAFERLLRDLKNDSL